MANPKEIHDSLEKFRKDHPNPKRVAFLMMRFEDKPAYNRILKTLKSSFQNNGITLLRADDKEYHSDLFLNIQTYMHGCGMGVAVLDRIQTEDFNPNVSLEIGYMLSMFKPILFLKDNTLKVLNTDLIGRLYKQFDAYDPENSIPSSVDKWLLDNGYCFSCFQCFVTLEKPVPELVSDQKLLDQCIADISVHSREDRTPVVKGIQQSIDGNNTQIVFEGDVEFYEQIKRLHSLERLTVSSQIKVVDVSSVNPDSNWGDHGLIPATDHLDGKAQICRLNAVVGYENLAEEASSFFNHKYVFNFSEACVYIRYHHDNSLHFMSNLINFNCQYPTKILVPLWLVEENQTISLLDISYSIACGPGLAVCPTLDEVIVNHVRKVKFYVPKSLLSKYESLPFTLDGAQNVEYIN